MKKQQDVSARIRNLARGGETYRHLRWKVFRAVISRPTDTAQPVARFLGRTFFAAETARKKRAEEVQRAQNALDLLPRDWDVADRLLENRLAEVNLTYLRLAADYIIANKVAVERLTAFERIISSSTLHVSNTTTYDDDTEALKKLFESINSADRQSVFMFKLYCALNSEVHQNIADYFAQNDHSLWVRQRLLYPLIFKYVNLTSDGNFEKVLDQVVPDLTDVRAEREAIAFLCTDEIYKPVSLSFKCYISMLCHPFDTLQMIIHHFEYALCCDASIPSKAESILMELYSEFKDHRIKNLLSIAKRIAPPFEDNPKDFQISNRLAVSKEVESFLHGYFCQSPDETSIAGLNPHLLALHRLRWTPYPTINDFQLSVLLSVRFGFCEVGRLVTVLLSSIYMRERRHRAEEYVHILRQLEFVGSLSPFTVCSPRGAEMVASGLLGNASVIEPAVDLAEAVFHQNTRWKLKFFHWSLRSLSRSMKISEWLAQVRKTLPLSGNSRFLSGIDWEWLDDVIEHLRIRPFRGNTDGIYVLLLRAVEQRQREPNTLKLALAPLVVAGSGVIELVKRLFSEYGRDTVAFIRFFLTPAMILKMKLEANYTAALSGRLDALRLAVLEYGYIDDIMTDQQYRHEQRSLTNMLTFMSVGAAQFEVPWEAFNSDAQENCDNEYKIFVALSKTYQNLSLLTNAKKDLTQVFSNKETRKYELKNSQWPLAMVIFSIIDTFLVHPSYGIEAILAIRIRHDNLRREFAVVISELSGMYISGMTTAERQSCLPTLQAAVNSSLQAWIDKYMHTRRGGEAGLFDFIPTMAELEHFLKELQGNPSKETITLCVVEWVRDRLNRSLDTARAKLRDELIPALRKSLYEADRTLCRTTDLSITAIGSLRAVADAAVERRATELLGWFETPTAHRTNDLTFGDLRRAVEGRFQQEVNRASLIVSFYSLQLDKLVVEPRGIRAVFDLWSELIHNAMKYCSRPVTRVRIQEITIGGTQGLRFSTLCGPDTPATASFDGKPDVADEPVLTVGQSGLWKVASLAATVTGQTARVIVVRRRRSHHVFVPLVEHYP